MKDHFERLGLPRRFAIDRDELEANYLKLSRETHPDRHRMGNAETQAESLQASAELNQAYTTLREPHRRAEYLLQLSGGPSASEDKGSDPAFLMEMMELRERIDAGGNRRDIALTLNAKLTELYNEIAELFATESVALSKIRQKLNAAKTIKSLLRDIDDE